MNAETLTALQESIAHWESVASGNHEDIGPRRCALCEMFAIGKHIDNICVGCPVAEATGKKGCRGTPYRSVEDALDDYGVNSDQFIEAAEKELAFLKSLLPS